MAHRQRTLLVLVHAVEDVLNQFPPERPHRLLEVREEGKPIDLPLLAKGLLKDLQLVLLEEDSVGVEGLHIETAIHARS